MKAEKDSVLSIVLRDQAGSPNARFRVELTRALEILGTTIEFPPYLPTEENPQWIEFDPKSSEFTFRGKVYDIFQVFSNYSYEEAIKNHRQFARLKGFKTFIYPDKETGLPITETY